MKLGIERLEDRIVPWTNFAGATITVYLTGYTDHDVHVQQVGSSIIVNEDGNVSTFAAAPVKSLILLGDPWGRNRMVVDVAVTAFIFGGHYDDYLDGSSYRNVFNPGAGRDTIIADGAVNSINAMDGYADVIYLKPTSMNRVVKDPFDTVIYI